MNLDERNFEVIALVVYCLPEARYLVHDEGFFSRVDDVEAVGEGSDGHTSNHQEISKLISHDHRLYFNSDDVGEIYKICIRIQAHRPETRQRLLFSGVPRLHL
jgi:hypothetical protein